MMSTALSGVSSVRIINRPRQASISSVRSTSNPLSPPPFGGLNFAVELGELDAAWAALDISREYSNISVPFNI